MDRPKMITRAGVKRDKADQYVLISLISFAGTILLTRLFLEITGYPQLGGGELHIAHVLWGGLFLFVAVMLPLILVNTWAIFWCALLGGVGFGLFIDELGKFLTKSNDYFYPPAAPIVYIVLLITVLVYIKVRRTPQSSARDELYRSLQNITELLDNDLDASERAGLKNRLSQIVANAPDSDIRDLANSLLTFISSDKLVIVPRRKLWFENLIQKITEFINRILSRSVFRWGLIAGLAWIAVMSVNDLVMLINISIRILSQSELPANLTRGDTQFLISPLWFTLRLGVQGFVGFIALPAIICYLMRKDKLATTLAILVLTVSLTVVNVMIFYLDQYSASINTLLELAFLFVVLSFRRRFISGQPSEQPAA